MKTLVFVFAAGALAASCSSNNNGTGAAAGATSGTSAQSGATGSTASGASTSASTGTSGSGGMAMCPSMSCPPMSAQNAGNKVMVGTVTATINADQNGMPVGKLDVQVCGTDLCVNGTGSNGSYSIAVNKTLTDPALKFGTEGDPATYLWWGGVLPDPNASYGTITAVALGSAGGMITAGATVTSSGVSVAIPAGASVCSGVDLGAPMGPFRAAVVKPSDGTFPQLAALPQFSAPKKLIGVVGLGPSQIDICPAAKLTFPNPDAGAGQEGGLKVELWLDGVKSFANWVPYGQWAKVADAAVSADGKTISTSDGSGIPALGAYAVVLVGPAL